MTEDVKNPQLKALMEEAGMSNKGLAARIRQLSAQHGDDPPARPDHNRVRRWIRDGEVPRERTQRLAAEVLSARLGRRIRPRDLGFSAHDTVDLDGDGARYPDSVDAAVLVLDGLVHADQADASIGRDWTPETTASVITGYLLAQPVDVDATVANTAGGRALPDRIRATTRRMMDLDFQFGGGYLRGMLLPFWEREVAPLLAVHHPDSVRRELFSAAAEVVQLLGWTSYDAGRHAAANRYFVQGLRLAREAGDHMLGGRLLSNLSHQANFLGHYNDAVQYARAAQQATVGIATPTVNTLFLAMEARALSSIGDARTAAMIMSRAEETFDRSRPESEPAWVSYVDQNELAGEWAHCFRDLGETNRAREYAALAVDGVPGRTQGFMRMITAQATAHDGDLDQAVTLARQAVDLAAGLDSARWLSYVADFRRQLGAARDPRIARFDALIRERYPTLVRDVDNAGTR